MLTWDEIPVLWIRAQAHEFSHPSSGTVRRHGTSGPGWCGWRLRPAPEAPSRRIGVQPDSSRLTTGALTKGQSPKNVRLSVGRRYGICQPAG